MQRGFTSFSVIIILIIVTLVGAGAYYLGKSNPDIPQPLSLPYSSTLPIPVDKNASTDETASWKTFEGKSTYSLGVTKGKFTISYPPECELGSWFMGGRVSINCPSQSFSINPQAGGHGAEVISNDQVTLGNISWDRTKFKNGESPKMGASYQSRNDEITQLVEVSYDNYSTTAEQAVEKIISTFKFLDENPVDGKACGYLPIPGSEDDANCPEGYKCQFINPSNDAGGICVKQE